MQIGDHIYVLNVGLWQHHGIYCGRNQVIHFSDGVVRRTQLAKFAKGAKVRIGGTAARTQGAAS